MEIKFQREEFKRAVDKVKALGYRVFIQIWNHDEGRGVTYVHIVNDKGQVGYMQQGQVCGCCFSTVHIPCRECGSGFGLDDTWNPIKVDCLAKKHIDRSFANTPSTWGVRHAPYVRKYTLESWLEERKKFCKDIIEY